MDVLVPETIVRLIMDKAEVDYEQFFFLIMQMWIICAQADQLSQWISYKIGKQLIPNCLHMNAYSVYVVGKVLPLHHSSKLNSIVIQLPLSHNVLCR